MQKKDENGNPMADDTGKLILEHPTCGGIIPKGQDKSERHGNFVYEFSGKGRQGSDGLTHLNIQDFYHPTNIQRDCILVVLNLK